jgi:hypothetical protein
MRRAAQRIFEDAISDSVVRGFLEDGDVAAFDVRDAHDVGSDAPFSIVVCRSRGDEELCIEVEASPRDMIVESLPDEDETDERLETEREGPNGATSRPAQVSGPK